MKPTRPAAPFADSRRPRAALTALGLLLAAGVFGGGCSCAVGRPSPDGSVAYDAGHDSGHDSGPGYDAGQDSGTVGPTCGNALLDSELFEVCDPNLPVGTQELLRCICPTDNSNCTTDVWVDHPTMGQCYGTCEHQPRSGYGITTCDDGDSCTIDTITSGSPATCDVTCTNLPPSMTDTTCNDTDDDCDGIKDDDYVPTATSCGTGPCASTGQNQCINGVVTDTCSPGTPGGNDNDCDGADDNCNGTADEGYAPVGTSCGVGACYRTGLSNCVGGVVGSDCVAGTPGMFDNTCDGVDQNCNGAVDEGYASVLTMCGVGACASTGSTTCYAGGVIVDSCMQGMGSMEVCDSIDNDCDGMVNDGNPGGGLPCTVPTTQGVCAAGTTSCLSGAIACVQTVFPTMETCDGLDNNCNGTPDEGTAGGACAVAGQQGPCATGAYVCNGAAGLSCMQTVMPSPEVCDAIDNNCDGMLNNGIASVACTSSNPGICAPGTTSCTANMTVCNSTIAPGSQPEVCVAGGGVGAGDSLDNNCDGLTDINPTVNDSIPTSCASAASRTVAVGVGGNINVTGNVDVNGVDYFLVDFQGATTAPNQFHPKITITSSVGSAYTFSLFTSTACNTPVVTPCGASAGNVYTQFEMLYPADPNACASSVADGRVATCSDSLARRTSYVVRVQRVASQVNCVNYTVNITN